MDVYCVLGLRACNGEATQSQMNGYIGWWLLLCCSFPGCFWDYITLPTLFSPVVASPLVGSSFTCSLLLGEMTAASSKCYSHFKVSGVSSLKKKRSYISDNILGGIKCR